MAAQAKALKGGLAQGAWRREIYRRAPDASPPRPDPDLSPGPDGKIIWQARRSPGS